MKKLLAGVVLIIGTCSLFAQQTVIQLYNGTAPG
jgi:hypothetical protein